MTGNARVETGRINSEETTVRIKASGDGGLTQERAVEGRKVDIFCR